MSDTTDTPRFLRAVARLRARDVAMHSTICVTMRTGRIEDESGITTAIVVDETTLVQANGLASVQADLFVRDEINGRTNGARVVVSGEVGPDAADVTLIELHAPAVTSADEAFARIAA